MFKLRTFLPILSLVVNTALTSGAAAADAAPRQIAFNEATQSYFELRTDLSDRSILWASAATDARRQTYHGVRGHLAVVRDQETMEFLQSNFSLDRPAWIGGRLFCDFHKIVWVNGKIHNGSDYSKWAAQWSATEARCPGVKWMPLVVTPGGSELFWRASAPGNGTTAYLVEYPTGRR